MEPISRVSVVFSDTIPQRSEELIAYLVFGGLRTIVAILWVDFQRHVSVRQPVQATLVSLHDLWSTEPQHLANWSQSSRSSFKNPTRFKVGLIVLRLMVRRLCMRRCLLWDLCVPRSLSRISSASSAVRTGRALASSTSCILRLPVMMLRVRRRVADDERWTKVGE
jgi:hypothetical protein